MGPFRNRKHKVAIQTERWTPEANNFVHRQELWHDNRAGIRKVAIGMVPGDGIEPSRPFRGPGF